MKADEYQDLNLGKSCMEFKENGSSASKLVGVHIAGAVKVIGADCLEACCTKLTWSIGSIESIVK